MRKWLSVSLMVGAVLAGGCGSDKDKDDDASKQAKNNAIDAGKAGTDSKTAASSNAAVVKMTNYAEILCACKNAACARGVHDTYSTWITGFSAADSKMTKADFDVWTAQQKNLLACWNKHKDATPAAPDLKKPADVVKLMTGFTDTMCACKDAKCASKVDKQAQAAAMGIDRKVLTEARKDIEPLYKRYKGCKENAESADGSDGGDDIENMTAFADDMCKCTDSTCAGKVHKSMMEWVKKFFKGGKKKGTKRNVGKWMKAQKKFNRCYIRAMKASLRDKPPATDDITRGIARYAQQVCACKTSLCATKAMTDHSKWVREHRTDLYTGANWQRYRQLLLEASGRALRCAKKLR